MSAPDSLIQSTKQVGTAVGDATAFAVTVGTVSNWFFGVGLPGLAALFTIIWTGFRIMNEYGKWKYYRDLRRKEVKID